MRPIGPMCLRQPQGALDVTSTRIFKIRMKIHTVFNVLMNA